LQSAEAFKIYLTCLEKVGQSASINAAVKKRDELLAASGVSPVTNPAPSNAPQQPTQPASLPTDPATAEPSKVQPVPTSSQVIADQVLSKPDAQGASSSRTPILDTFKSSNNSSQNAPIQVTIVERQSVVSSITPN
jgi:ATP-dependent metalloprotease